MRSFGSKLKDFGYFLWRWINPIIDPFRLINAFPGYICYFRDWLKYSRLQGSEKIKILNAYPCIHDKTKTTDFTHHYFYQDIWAFKKIYESKPDHHVDVGSLVYFVGFLTTFTSVTFVDIRPLKATIDNFSSKEGTILSLPFKDNSLQSLSCLHVAEHIGLGRYGDTLDVDGTNKACKELSRVLAPHGKLYFSVPVGKPMLCFNAHRIVSAQQILDYFSELELIELSGIDDKENLIKNVDISILNDSTQACGLFIFTKK
jgi:Caenorhabditis protein of unknown function, DUF268